MLSGFAGIKDQRNIGSDFFHLGRDLNASCAPQHMIGQDQTHGCFTKRFQGLRRRAHANDVVARFFENSLAQV